MSESIKKYNLILEVPVKLMTPKNTEDLLGLLNRLLSQEEEIDEDETEHYELKLIEFIKECFNKFKIPIKELETDELKNEFNRLIEEEAQNHPYQVFLLALILEDAGEPFEDISTSIRRNFFMSSDASKIIEFSQLLHEDSSDVFHAEEHIAMLNEKEASQPNFLLGVFEVLSSDHQTNWLKALIDKKQYSTFWSNMKTLTLQVSKEQRKTLIDKILEETKGQIDPSHQLEFYRVLDFFKSEIEPSDIDELRLQLKKMFVENLNLIPNIYEYVKHSSLLDDSMKKALIQEVLIEMLSNLNSFHVVFQQLFELTSGSVNLNNVYKISKVNILNFIIESRQHAFLDYILNNLNKTNKKELVKKVLNEVYKLISTPSNQPILNYIHITVTLLAQHNRGILQENMTRVSDLAILFTQQNRNPQVYEIGVQLCELIKENKAKLSAQIIAQLTVLNTHHQVAQPLRNRINTILQ